MAPSRTVAVRPVRVVRGATIVIIGIGGGIPGGDDNDSDSDSVITPLLPTAVSTGSMPDSTPAMTPFYATSETSLSITPPTAALSTKMYVISATPSEGSPPLVAQSATDPTDPDLAGQKATSPLRILAAVFGFLAILFLLAVAAIVLRVRLKNRRRLKRARVRSAFWTGSRADALAVVLAQPLPSSYATPGQELWAKQWAELCHASETRRTPETASGTLSSTPALGTLTLARSTPVLATVTLTMSSRSRPIAFRANTPLVRWSASLRSDDSPGSPPPYRSPSGSYARDSSGPAPPGNRLLQAPPPAVALTRVAAFIASTGRPSEE
ncbi:hypothetical protein AURDEDRAFT_126501 [Auricularia subglabra TFB-10046 SS5]|nr:hypothetical protein AURDEDRAFT_126501 [Auricularia subglabra TFB-10046 SS5]